MDPIGLGIWQKHLIGWMLPAASESKESIVLLLDRWAGHRTEEVAELVRKQGHVLVFQGAGCTPFTQINETQFARCVGDVTD